MAKQAEFAGKVIFVTGAGSGIGRGIAEAFAREGGRVIVADLDLAGAEETVAGIVKAGYPGSARACKVNVASELEVEKLVKDLVAQYGRIDILVNNAGITGTQSEPHLATEAEFDQVFAVNVKGVWLCTKHCLAESMLPNGKGAIVNIASISGYIGNADLPLYHATKGAVRLMSKTDAVVYAKRGIRVNCINPGSIITPLSMKSAETYPGGPAAQDEVILKQHPIGRRGVPADIAEAALYLASDRASFVTGADLFVDGGFTAQ
ncbi:Glucose 1-dehydrogenase 2 [compost metagenome]